MEYFIDAFRRFADFEGRSTRSEYWSFQLLSTLVGIILAQGDVQSGTWNPEYAVGMLSGLYSAIALIPSLAILVRRFHDTGKSGWMALLLLLPIIGWSWVIYQLFQPSQSNTEGE